MPLPAPRNHSPTVLSEFLQVARRWPERPALRWRGQEIGYRALSTLSSRIASALRAEGAAPGDVVGIHGRASVGLVASLLGVWRTGGVILPLDADLPHLRKEMLLRESGARHVVDLDAGGPRAWAGLPVIPVGLDGRPAGRVDGAGAPGGDAVPAEASPAYVFFTSGTTGTPKGVLGRHGSLAHVIGWERGEFAVGPGDRVAQLTRISFDYVMHDLCVPLTAGATLVLPDPVSVSSGAAVFRWLERDAITILHTVPTLMRSWLSDVPAATRLPALRAVFFVGEPLTAELVARFREEVGFGGEIVNLYGPTETTLIQFFYRVPESPRPGVQSLGFPLPGTRAFVADGDGRPCPAGVLGEIYIDTRYGTLGYLNAPEEQERRFLPNPFAGGLSPRVYRTGDLGRLEADGSLSFAGRVDHQVKINGVRIEPEEVAAVLAGHPGVAACAVLAERGARDGDVQLVAYWVAREEGPRALPDDLREYLAQRVAPVMIPRRFPRVTGLPCDPNGKLDRRALAALAVGETAGGGPEPRTPTERALADIWRRLLGVERVSLTDSFFTAGGDSLSALEAVALVRRELRKDVPLQGFLDAPSLADLAALVERAGGDEEQGVPAYAARNSYPLSPAQRCYVAVCMPGGNSSGCNVLTRIEVPGPLAAEEVAEALSVVVARHDVLRCVLVEEDGELRQRYVEPGPVPVEPARCADAPGEDPDARLREVAAALASAPLAIGEWPLLRAVLAPVSRARSVVLVVAHHLVMDGYSSHLLRSELGEILAARRRGTPPALEPVRASYRDFALWQGELREREGFQEDRAYWEARFPRPVRDTSFPPHQPLSPLGDRSFAYLHEVPSGVAAAARELSRERRCSLFALLLAGYLLLVAESLGRSDVGISVPMLGRPRRDLLHVLGCFATLGLVHRVLRPSTPFARLVEEVASDLGALQRHSSYQYDDLLRRFAVPAPVERFPLTSVMFNQEHSATPLAALLRDRGGVSRDMGRDIRFDLQGLVLQDGERVVIDFIYRRGVLTHSEASRLSGRLDEILRTALRAPSARLDRIVPGLWPRVEVPLR